MESLVTLENIRLTYNRKEVLHDIKLQIHSDEFLTVIGPNGAGKTSLLKLIIGLETPTEGKISRKPGLKISYLPQKFTCNPSIPINVDDFIRLSEKISKTEIREALEKVGLENIGKQFLGSLSGGELQRIMIAKTLLSKPDLIILDEPGQNVDFAGQLLIYELIESMYKRLRCSILMVSHDIHMVMSQTNTVICMYKHICCKGKPESIRNDSSFIRHFGKISSELLATYKHSHAHSHGSHMITPTNENTTQA